MNYTKKQIKAFAEESVHYTVGSITLDQVLENIGATVADDRGMGEAIDAMHAISPDYDDKTLSAAEDIMEQFQMTFSA